MKDAEGRALAVGDIVQITPEANTKLFSRCVGVVAEVKSFGAIIDFIMPGYGIAPLRSPSDDFVIVGRVKYPIEEPT